MEPHSSVAMAALAIRVLIQANKQLRAAIESPCRKYIPVSSATMRQATDAERDGEYAHEWLRETYFSKGSE